MSSVEKCVSEYLRKESGVNDVEEVSSDDGDKDGENADVEEKITTYEALTMIDKLINLKDLNIEERVSLSSLKERLEIIRVNDKKQQSIKDFFK